MAALFAAAYGGDADATRALGEVLAKLAELGYVVAPRDLEDELADARSEAAYWQERCLALTARLAAAGEREHERSSP